MDVVAPHERNMLAELETKRSISLRRCSFSSAGHLVENFRAGRIVVRETVGEIREDAAVLLLVADGEGQNFALG